MRVCYSFLLSLSLMGGGKQESDKGLRKQYSRGVNKGNGADCLSLNLDCANYWANHITSLCLMVLICKMGIIRVYIP